MEERPEGRKTKRKPEKTYGWLKGENNKKISEFRKIGDEDQTTTSTDNC